MISLILISIVCLLGTICLTAFWALRAGQLKILTEPGCAFWTTKI
jgi:cbb3-type cytochrome oxidase maturation protein